MKCGSWPLPLTKKAARSGSRVKLTSFPVHVGKKKKIQKKAFFRFFFFENLLFWPFDNGSFPLWFEIRFLVVIFWDFCKQWLLAGEFSEFEYSPEICHFWRIRVLAKIVFLKNWSDSLNSPSFANLVCSDSPDSLTFAKPFCEDSPNSRKPSFASNKQICRVWQI